MMHHDTITGTSVQKVVDNTIITLNEAIQANNPFLEVEIKQ